MSEEKNLSREPAVSQAREAGKYVLAILKWLPAAGALGVVCGLVGAGFHKSIDFVTELRMGHPWLVGFLALAGVVTLLLYRLCRVDLSAGTNLVFRSVTSGEKVPLLLAPLIVAGTVLSHLFGASVGREGAALQLGGSLGHNFGRLFRFDDADCRTLTMSGMAACFSALFGTPLAALFFVLEVTVVGTVRYYAVLPCAVASYTAFLTAGLLGVPPMGFTVAGGLPELTWLTALQTAGLAAAAGLVAAAFCLLLHWAEHGAKKLLKNPYLRIAAGGLAMSLLTVGFDLYEYNGAGTNIISAAMAGEAEPLAFLLKLALTVLCVGVGFRGGEIVPSMFIGAAFGCVFGPLLGLPAGASAALGLIALFCSATNAPIASIFLAVELFGTARTPLFAIAAVSAFVVSGYTSLYGSQMTTYSKVKLKMHRDAAQ